MLRYLADDLAKELDSVLDGILCAVSSRQRSPVVMNTVTLWRGAVQGDSLDPRTASATGTPEGAHDHAGVIERVIKMGVDSPEVDTANAGNGRLSVQGSGTWKHRDDLERLFEFLGEHVGVVTIGQPPGLLSPNVFLRSGCEVNAAILQRDRSSRRITSASTRRPALMSSSESLRA